MVEHVVEQVDQQKSNSHSKRYLKEDNNNNKLKIGRSNLGSGENKNGNEMRILQRRKQERRMAFEILHRIAQKQALFDETNIHDHDQNIEYDEYSDDDEYDANDINNRKDENKYSKLFSTQENKARKNKSFHPPPDTVLYCALKKTQEDVTKKRLKIDRFIIPPHNYVV